MRGMKIDPEDIMAAARIKMVSSVFEGAPAPSRTLRMYGARLDTLTLTGSLFILATLGISETGRRSPDRGKANAATP
jgi:hypothetical protein